MLAGKPMDGPGGPPTASGLDAAAGAARLSPTSRFVSAMQVLELRMR
jgi:hypothetical protein